MSNPGDFVMHDPRPENLNDDKRMLVDEVFMSFTDFCRKELGARIESLYSVGSYAFGKISIERPDLNFLIVLKQDAVPQDYLALGHVCQRMSNVFQGKCGIRVEFRPFRYIYPKTRADYDIFLNPIVTSVGEVRARGVIFNKYFTHGMKGANKLIAGADFLSELHVSKLTRQDIIQGALFDLPFLTIPLTRAPAQYDENEYDLLFNEALKSGQETCSVGLEVAMSDSELEKQEFLKYIENKEMIPEFYRTRYGEGAADIVAKIYDAREHYLEYKGDKKRAEEMFGYALQISGIVWGKLMEAR
jgi:hypothetical protein